MNIKLLKIGQIVTIEHGDRKCRPLPEGNATGVIVSISIDNIGVKFPKYGDWFVNPNEIIKIRKPKKVWSVS